MSNLKNGDSKIIVQLLTAKMEERCKKAERQAKEGKDEAAFGFIKEYERSFRVFVENLV